MGRRARPEVQEIGIISKSSYLGLYQVSRFGKDRIQIIEAQDAAVRRHHVAALLELDVTRARAAIKRYRSATGRGLSFLAWLLATIGKTCSEYPQVHAWRQGRRKIVTFEDVDISIVIERDVSGQLIPLPYVIRKTNEKSPFEIHEEIRAAQTQKLEPGQLILGSEPNIKFAQLGMRLPSFARRMFWRLLARRAFWAKRTMGTVALTSVGMFGKTPAWPINSGSHTLIFALGSLSRKPGVIEGRIESREYLHMTVLIDHDIVDGAPAARFLARLSRLVEKAHGLNI